MVLSLLRVTWGVTIHDSFGLKITSLSYLDEWVDVAVLF